MTAHGIVRQLFAGIDWASKTHMICVVDQDGKITIRFEIPNTGRSFTGLVKRLTKLGVQGVAIERCDRPLVEALLDAGLRVVVITPPGRSRDCARATPAPARSPTRVMPTCSPTCCAPTGTASPH